MRSLFILLLMAFVGCGRPPTVYPEMRTQTVAPTGWNVYTLLTQDDKLFSNYFILLFENADHERFVILSSREVPAMYKSSEFIKLKKGDRYSLELKVASATPLPEPSIRAPWDNLSVGLIVHDSLLTIWKNGAMTRPVFESKSIICGTYIDPTCTRM